LSAAHWPDVEAGTVDEADKLHAVWDGKSASSYGGTADVVTYARKHGIPVRVIWPDGARRG
jgi:hypothetical protein